MHAYRAQVGEHAEFGTQAQQSLFRPQFGLGVGPLRSTDSAEHHRVGLLADDQRLGGQRVAVRVDRAAADRVLTEFEIVTLERGDVTQHADRGGGDFRTDAIARQYGDARLHAASPRWRSNCPMASLCASRKPSWSTPASRQCLAKLVELEAETAAIGQLDGLRRHVDRKLDARIARADSGVPIR